VLVAVAAYAATFGTLGILQYQALNVAYNDTANFEEMLWRTLHGQFLRCSGFPHNFLGEHVELIHLFLLPIYVLYPNLQTLMLCETAALAAGSIPIYLLAAAVVRSRWIGCALGISYLLYAPMQMLNLEGGGSLHTFRPETFSVPLVLAAFYCLVRGRLVVYSAFAFLTLLCKEEFGLVVLMLGLYAAVILKRRAFGLISAGFGLAWFAASLGLVIPYFRGGPSHSIGYYSNLGGSVGEIAANVLLHPIRTLQIAFEPEKLEFLHLLFFPVAYLCLLSPITLAIALPHFGLSLLSGRYASFMPWFHYHAPIVPFILIASVYGTRNLIALARLCEKGQHGQKLARAVAWGAGVVVLLCALVTNIIYSKSPLSFRFYDPESISGYRLYLIPPRAREAREIVRSVPRDKRVSASLFLATRFTHHAAAYVFPQGFEEGHTRPPDYVVLDLEERWFLNSGDQRAALERLEKGTEYERLPAPEGFLILRRRAP